MDRARVCRREPWRSSARRSAGPTTSRSSSTQGPGQTYEVLLFASRTAALREGCGELREQVEKGAYGGVRGPPLVWVSVPTLGASTYGARKT